MSEIVAVGEHQNGQQVELLLGHTLRVTLPEVRTAGFRWSLRTSSERILAPVADDTSAVSTALGSAAQHHWDFQAEKVGTTELVFEYDRPWTRAAAAARTFSVSVRVTDSRRDAAQHTS
ncbi:MAG TPA: protease inhibitor I42 family protein [Candidatus Acidoferrales bacterium]